MSHVIRHPKSRYHMPHGLEYNTGIHSGIIITISQIVWVFTGLLVELLAVRFMIAFLGASPTNAFFNWIYTASQPFIAPFANTFGDATQIGPNRFEFYTLIAIAFYAMIGYGIARLITWREPELDENL